MLDINNQFHNDVKVNNNDDFWLLINLLNDMRNGSGHITWVVNTRPESKMTKNLEKAQHHINIACEILRGTMYEED